MKKIIITLVSFLLIFTSIPMQAFAASGPDVAAKSAIAYIGDTNQVLWEKESDTPYNPASVTKLMTCLLAIEQLGLDKEVTVDKSAPQIKYIVPVIHEGEVLTVEQLVYLCMLISANDAAKQLAISVSGSEKKFAKLMNERAAQIGCRNAEFHNASGTKEKCNYMSAKDMALIAKEALSNPDLRRICGTAEYEMAATNMSPAKTLKTTNLFISGGTLEMPNGKVSAEVYPGVFGGKTGLTLDNMCTMVVGCEMDGLEVYAAVMETTYMSKYKDIKAILDYIRNELNPYYALKKGDDFGKTKIRFGATNKIQGIAADDGLINLPEGASASLVTCDAVFDEELKAPLEAGQTIGKVVIRIADEPVRTVDLVAASAVKEGWFLSRFYVTNFATVIIGLVILLFISFVLLVLILRAKNRKKRERLRKEKIREAARKQMEQERDWNERGWTYH